LKDHEVTFIIKNCNTQKEKQYKDFIIAEKEIEKIRKQQPSTKFILLCKVQ